MALDNNAVVLACGVTGFCEIRPPVNCETGGETVIGLDVARGLTRPVAFEVHSEAVTAGALTVVGVRVCLCVVATVVTFGVGVPPVILVVIVFRLPTRLEPLTRGELARLEPPPLAAAAPLPCAPRPPARAILSAPH